MAILPMYVKCLVEEIIYYQVSGTSEARTPAQKYWISYTVAEPQSCTISLKFDGQFSFIRRTSPGFQCLGVHSKLHYYT